MPQEDYVIANQSFPSFRADLNKNLEAIATNNSGDTEPTTPFPYMLWADTTAGIMKQRNSSNSAWIEVWDLSVGIETPASVPAGAMIDFAGSVAPEGYVLCDGATLDSVDDTTLANLFVVIGTTYGGSGADDFNVPDFRGRVAIGLDNLGGVSANRMTNVQADALGGGGGSEAHALSTSELATHDHDYEKHSGVSAILGGTGGTSYFDQMRLPATQQTGTAGNGTAHPNDQPWIALTKIIKK